MVTDLTADDLRDEILLTILAGQLAHPRSQQAELGPSEIGTPCERKLAYHYGGAPRTNDRAPSWRTTVGVAVHAWLEHTFGTVALPTGEPRYLVEKRVMVGQIAGIDVWGTADLYCTVTGTVVDAKIVGPTSLKDKRRNGVGQTYRVQRHLYGRGLALAGHDVRYVANLVLPAAGELHDTVLDIEPYDERVATDALERASRIASGASLLGLSMVLGAVPHAEDYCPSCPWWAPGSTDLTSGCPGVTPPPAAPALTLVSASNPSSEE